MLAFLIRISKIFPGELALRFFGVVLSVVGVYFLFAADNKSEPSNFVLSLTSFPILIAFQFLAVPDTILISLVSIYYYFILRSEKNNFWMNSICFGLILTALAYTKYHSVLVLFFTILAMPHLLKRKWFYAGGVLAFLLLLPHLYWQFSHEWVSFLYHISGRHKMPWSAGYIGEYLLTQFF